jgi:hypothetical protein
MRNFKLVESDYDFKAYQRVFSGRITKRRYKIIDSICRKKSYNQHCGCEHDCCGCMFAQSIRFEYKHNRVVMTLTESYNY